jgi:glycerophosphoryl diester phosphodiesterase
MFFNSLPRRILNIAHRGARSLAPENTLCAARKGFEAGADAWELDVRLTADGEPLVIHDATLERTSNVKQVKTFRKRRPWNVHEFTLAEIGLLNFGEWFVKEDPLGGIRTYEVEEEHLERYRGEPAPTLREALSLTRDLDWRVNVEIKDLTGTPGDAEIVGRVLDLVLELEMVERVLISSFRHDYLRRIKERVPEVATGALVNGRETDPPGLLRDLGAEAYHPPASATDHEQIQDLLDQGHRVLLWTVNQEADLRRAVGSNPTGIITDFPQRLKPLLNP